MKQIALWTMVFGLIAVAPAPAQEHAEKAAEKAGEHESSGEGEHGGMEIWKWANFAILAGGLGYLVGKNAGPFFAGRTQQIRKEMIEAGELRKQAEMRAAEVDHRLANLENEIAAMRAEAKQEAEDGNRAAFAAHGRRNRQSAASRRAGHRGRGQSCPYGAKALFRRTGGATGRAEDPGPHESGNPGLAGDGICEGSRRRRPRANDVKHHHDTFSRSCAIRERPCGRGYPFLLGIASAGCSFGVAGLRIDTAIVSGVAQLR